uniref:Uncharacterized protein LOC108051572 n=2 Tax=Drosophila rhopaloa TaxID=1041015 RepID=A0A6P4FFL8_DRORH
MFKSAVVIFAIVACVAAKPGLLGAPLAYTSPLAYTAPLAYSAPVVAAPAPVVTATSSQVIARNYNGIAAAPVIAPVAAPVVAKYAAAPLAAPLAYSSPLAYSAPLSYAALSSLDKERCRSSGVAQRGGVGQGGGVRQRGGVGQRSRQRSSRVLGNHGSSHRSNHWRSCDSIVVPGDHLATGGSHNWSRSSHHRCRVCQRSSVGQGGGVSQWRSVGQRSTQKSWLGSSTGNKSEDNDSLRIKKFNKCYPLQFLSGRTYSTITMFKSAVVVLAIVACAAAKPGLLGAPLAYSSPLAYTAPLAYSAPVVAAPAPVVTATSSQVIARNYNGIAAAPVIAPVAAPLVAKYAAAPLAAPLAYSSPLAYTSPLAYSAPLSYAAAPAPLLI